MSLNFEHVRERLDAFEFGRLLIEELGWSNPTAGGPSTMPRTRTPSADAVRFGAILRRLRPRAGVGV